VWVQVPPVCRQRLIWNTRCYLKAEEISEAMSWPGVMVWARWWIFRGFYEQRKNGFSYRGGSTSRQNSWWSLCLSGSRLTFHGYVAGDQKMTTRNHSRGACQNPARDESHDALWLCLARCC
jgi:hypothetical protein